MKLIFDLKSIHRKINETKILPIVWKIYKCTKLIKNSEETGDLLKINYKEGSLEFVYEIRINEMTCVIYYT